MKKIITFTLMSVLFIAGLAVAQPGHGNKNFKKGKRPDGIRMILKMSDKLELTENQTAQLDKMAVDFKLEQIDLKAEIKKEEVMMKSLMRDENASEREVFSKIDKITALKADSKKMQFSHKKAVQEVLTDKQTEMLKEFRKNHKRAGMRGHPQCNQSECDGHGKNFKGGHGDGLGKPDGKGNFHKN